MSDITETARSFQDTGSDERTTGVAAGRRPRLGWILGLTSAAYFMVVLDSLVVITARATPSSDPVPLEPLASWICTGCMPL